MSHAEASRQNVAIIGVGSPFGGDQLGWWAVERLAHSHLPTRFPEYQFRFEQADRPGSSLLQYLRGVEVAVVIDAMQAGLSSGVVQPFAVDELLALPGRFFSSHSFGVVESLMLGATLGELPPCLLIMGIEVGSNGGEGILEEATVQQLLRLIEMRLAPL